MKHLIEIPAKIGDEIQLKVTDLQDTPVMEPFTIAWVIEEPYRFDMDFILRAPGWWRRWPCWFQFHCEVQLRAWILVNGQPHTYVPWIGCRRCGRKAD